ncbi:transketolase family protein [Candidatus Woesearchaeota archaeon]|nr:transketolase family protein [Candidatus Woesearchaeota archaeon]MCF7901439.1 transketolase family protein [Candidatus Woesearchaeota archaeon]MCF8013015.1 transketolase family protein [Candidatus Woesearchaeota archaeon]
MKTKKELELKSTREGFGEGVLLAANRNAAVWALTADLAGSTGLGAFLKAYPERFVEVGVAEQNLVTVASGLAATGKIPFATSFAAFSPGRNWEQIKTTICYNDQPVIVVGSHTGLGVGEDGATHQMLEDLAMMRAIPNMQVIVPCDFEQAKKATIALTKNPKPTYLRLTRQKQEQITTTKTEFKIGKAQILKKGKHLTIIGTGPILNEAKNAAASVQNAEHGNISVEIINIHTIKPLDTKTILKSIKKTGKVITLEDHQITGGLGSAISELIAENSNILNKDGKLLKFTRIGVKDSFGESGTIEELYEKHKMNAKHILLEIKKINKL